MTTTGSTWHYNLTTQEIEAAESFDAIAYKTTGRTASVDFTLMSFTATQLAIALNGATKTVTGSTSTTLTKISVPTPGQETRFMLGFESLDATVRMIAYQVINSGDISMQFQKAPAVAGIPFTVNCEIPASPTLPFDIWTAGVARG
jgi:hypothetical protein